MIKSPPCSHFLIRLIAAALCLLSSNLYAAHDYNADIDFLRNDNVVLQGAILSNDDGKVLAASPGLTIGTHPVETVLLLDFFASNGHIKSIPAVLWIGGVKYQIVMFNQDTKTAYLRNENGGACLVKTAKTIIFGSFDQNQKQNDGVPQNLGDTNEKLQKLAKQLKDAGY